MSIPGPSQLIAGDMQAGYFGTVPASELWTGSELAEAVGISQGTVQHNETDWLKFAWKGKILFRPMKPFRHTISWDHINTAGCVYGGKVVEKNGLKFKVRLMKGTLTNPSKSGDLDKGAKGSEWNQLMLPIHEQASDKSWSNPDFVEDDIPDWGIGFTDADLVTIHTAGSGAAQWCQESLETFPNNRVTRGFGGVSHIASQTNTYTGTGIGWAPVLEVPYILPPDTPLLDVVQATADLVPNLNDVQTMLSATVESKGGTVPANPLWTDINAAIAGIEVGKYATGTIYSTSASKSLPTQSGSSGLTNYIDFDFSMLDFIPDILKIIATNKNDIRYSIWFYDNFYTVGSLYANAANGHANVVFRVPYLKDVVSIPVFVGDRSYTWEAWKV